jgi:hypothetical protein
MLRTIGFVVMTVSFEAAISLEQTAFSSHHRLLEAHSRDEANQSYFLVAFKRVPSLFK